MASTPRIWLAAPACNRSEDSTRELRAGANFCPKILEFLAACLRGAGVAGAGAGHAVCPWGSRRCGLSVLVGDDPQLRTQRCRGLGLSLIHISEPTRLGMISYAVFCLKKKKHKTTISLIIKLATSTTIHIITTSSTN